MKMSCNLTEVLLHYPEISGVHPACTAVPEISEEDRVVLEKDIAEKGLCHEIVLTHDRLLLDGRNRLIACFNGSIEPRFKIVSDSVDPWEYSASENIARRHLTTFAKCAFGDAWREHEEAEAKKRQGARTDIKETFPESLKGQTRDKIGERVGVSGKSMDKFRDIKEHAPDDVKAEASKGSMSLEAAYKVARKQKQSFESHVDMTEKETVPITTASGIESVIDKPKKSVFNKTNDSVDWASWTWNPVTGCNHGCKFCYAREIANSQRMKPYYPNGFEPTFHEYRLDAPKNTNRPDSNDERDGRVFVCSMADLFGKWVPKDWIQRVFESCLASPEWEYMFLTKWPARYSQMPLIDSAWYGASVIQQSDVKRVESAMQQFSDANVVRWISMEPMLEPIVFNDISWCNLLVIGSQTSTNQPEGFVPEFAPDFDWIVDVVNQCREQGVPYYLKENVGMSRPGMKLPKSKPRK